MMDCVFCLLLACGTAVGPLVLLRVVCLRLLPCFAAWHANAVVCVVCLQVKERAGCMHAM